MIECYSAMKKKRYFSKTFMDMRNIYNIILNKDEYKSAYMK